MPRISLIAALSENHVIGVENRLPWHLPADWENFRKVTRGKAFIMGRLSYEAEDALHSEKKNVILSRRQLNLPKGFLLANSIDQALHLLKEESELFILGGETVFRQTLHLADYMYLTIVHQHFEGDAYFPRVNWEKWQLVHSKRIAPDERHDFAFSMNEYSRKSR